MVFGSFAGSIALLIASGCSDVGAGARSGSGLNTGSGAATGMATGMGGVVVTGVGGASAAGGTLVNPTGGSGGSEECNAGEVNFEPKTPIVYILVDRSSSMFEQNFWAPLQSAVLSVVEETENDVIFGFAAYTGYNGGVCPELTEVPEIKLGNYADISATYTSLVAPTGKGETPTATAIDGAVTRLAMEDPETPKFILLVTDGQPDFCDDVHLPCGVDGLVGALQRAYSQLVGTFVMAIAGTVPAEYLQQYANAGAGQPVGMPIGPGTVQELGYQCPAPANPQNGTPFGSYLAPAGAAPYFTPQANEQELVTQLKSVVSSVKPCEYDLGGNIEVDLTRLDQGHVYIGDVEVPLDSVNGWSMDTGTRLILNGASCEQLRQPTAEKISWNFPCEIIVVT